MSGGFRRTSPALGSDESDVDDVTWIDDDARFSEVVDELVEVEAYALDTEFHRERTYFPQLALLQLAWPGGSVLVDPLAVDLAPLAKVFAGPAVAVIHAASQDLEVLELACGSVPGVLFDTQVAAGFVGFSTPSLAQLLERLLKVQLPKADRLTDWLRRPLGHEAKVYAAGDVTHLLELRDILVGKLEARGRLEWAATECDLLRLKSRGGRNPEQAWMRIKEARSLSGRAAGVARTVAAWRERRAADTDQPVRFVLPDLALVGIAQRPPTSLEELRGVRGLDGRFLRGGAGESLLAAIREGVDAPPPPKSEVRDPMLDRDLRPAVTLVSAWIAQLARDLDLDTALLATRSDIEALLGNVPGARLAEGWRAEIVGEPVRRLVQGDAALAFDRKGGLVLEDRVGHDPT